MKSAVVRRSFASGLLAALVSGTLFWFAIGLNPQWPLMWIASLPVLVYAAWSSAGRAMAVAFAAMLLGSLSMWSYFRILELPPQVWLVTFGGASLLFACAVLLFRGLLVQGRYGWAMVAFPALYVTGEFAVARFSSGGTAGNLAYTQLKCLPLLQIASITGLWGVSFLVLLFASSLVVVLVLHQSGRSRQSRRALGAACAVFVLAFGYGWARLSQPEGPKLRVGLISSDEPRYILAPTVGAASLRLAEVYAAEAKKLAQQGAVVIVLPEKLFTVDPSMNGVVDRLFQEVAEKTGVRLVVGMVYLDGSRRLNQARVYAPSAAGLRFNKHHLVPGWEAKFSRGTGETEFMQGPLAAGVAICKDMDFSALSRSYGLHDVGLMVVPAWDFDVDRVWHGHIAMMRGVENGFSVVRAAKGGNLFASDSRGRILGERVSAKDGFSTLIVDVPAGHSATPYQRIGDAFAWVLAGGVLAALARVLWPRRPTLHKVGVIEEDGAPGGN